MSAQGSFVSATAPAAGVLPALACAVRLARRDFTLDIAFEARARVVALFGPSGAGKTTLLNLIAGIEKPDSGRIVLGDHVAVDTAKAVFVPSHKRRASVVFQDAQLFPHMSVAQNLRFGAAFAPKDAKAPAWDTVVETLGISHLEARYPARLSGGEKQRVALARALLCGPRILLMDEPLASLDDKRKQEVLGLIARVRDEFAIPMVYVSHAVAEIRQISDCVVLIEDGRVVTTGAPSQIL